MKFQSVKKHRHQVSTNPEHGHQHADNLNRLLKSTHEHRRASFIQTEIAILTSPSNPKSHELIQLILQLSDSVQTDSYLVIILASSKFLLSLVQIR